MRFIVGLILCLCGLSSWSIVSGEAIKQDSIDSPSGKNSLGALIKSAARKSAIREAESADGCEGVEWTEELRKNHCLNGTIYGSRYGICWKQCSHGGNSVCDTGSSPVTPWKDEQAEECSRLSQSCITACFDNWEELDAIPLPTLAPRSTPPDNGCKGVEWTDPNYEIDYYFPQLRKNHCLNGTSYGSRYGICWKQCSQGGNTVCETGSTVSTITTYNDQRLQAEECSRLSQSCSTACFDNWEELDAIPLPTLTAATTTAATTTTTRSHGGSMVRPDGRCAGRRGGQPGKCDPNGESPCCSAYGWCGSSAQHCQCTDCIDFRFLVRENQDWYCGVTFDNKDGPISRTTTWDDALAFLGVNLNKRGTAARGVVWMRGSNPHIPAILIGNGGEYGNVFDPENRHILQRCHNAYVDEVMNPKFD